MTEQQDKLAANDYEKLKAHDAEVAEKAATEARKDERKRYACNLETIRPPKDCFSHFKGYDSIKCKECSQWGYCADITVRCTAAREDEQRKWRDEHPGDLVWMTPEEEEARIRRDEREKIILGLVRSQQQLLKQYISAGPAMREMGKIRSETYDDIINSLRTPTTTPVKEQKPPCRNQEADGKMNKSEAERILARFGYDWSLSDVEDACKFLDHPELTEEDSANHHGWADPYPRRCYCSAIAYTDKGRVYAISLSDNVKKIHQQIFGAHYPDGTEIRDRCGEPYIKKK